MKTIAVNIEKGGAGKTTIAWHFADAGHRVLVLDLDRQCNATAALREFEGLGTCKPLFEDGYTPSQVPRLGLYSNRMGGEYDGDCTGALSAFSANSPKLGPHFDFCVIDTPPTWNWINFAALIVCDDLIVPALKAKIGRNLFTAYLPDRAHYSQSVQEGVPVWRYDKDVRGSLPPMRAFLDEAMSRMGV